MSHRKKTVLVGVDGAVARVVEGLVKQGHLPNMERLMHSGTWCKNVLPAFPTITPTCWATIATGATPATHGITCQDIHLPGEPFHHPRSGYRAEMTQVERIWEAAERGGKRCLVVQYPTSGPTRLQHGYQVNGTTCSAVEVSEPAVPTGRAGYDGVEGQLFSSRSGHRTTPVQLLAGLTPPSGQWTGPAPDTAVPLHPADSSHLYAVLPATTTQSLHQVEAFAWVAILTPGNTVAVHDDPAGPPVTVLNPGEWSEVLERRISISGCMRLYRYRIKVLEASYEERALKLYITPLADAAHVVPDAFAASVDRLDGLHTFTHHSGHFGSGELDDDTYLEIEEMNLQRLLDITRLAWDTTPIDFTTLYTVMLDTINHKYRNIIEGYVAADGATFARACRTELRGYQIIDRFLGELWALAGKDATICVVSDHGSTGYLASFEPRRALEKAGLTVMKPAEPGRPAQVDEEQSRAIPFSSAHIFVNLRGREAHGIVEEADYEATVDAVIRTLYDYTDETTGRKPIAIALRRSDAGLIGLGGERSGDVVFGVTGGIGGHIGGVHACQVPTAVSRAGDMRAVWLLAGPGIRHGRMLERNVRQWDIAPTLAECMGITPPDSVEGGVIRQMLD